MIIQIKDGLAEVSYKKGKRNFDKVITIPALIDAMVSEKGLESPMLPFGCRKYIRKENTHTVYLELPEIKRNVIYKNRSDKIIFEGIVPLPWGLMKLTFVDSNEGKLRLSNSQIWALSKPLTSLNDDYYFYPVPNIFNDQRICWGSTFSNGTDRIDDISQAGRIIDLFFSSDYNTDIAPRINKHERYEDMLREIKDLSKFPKDSLAYLGKISNIL